MFFFFLDKLILKIQLLYIIIPCGYNYIAKCKKLNNPMAVQFSSVKSRTASIRNRVSPPELDLKNADRGPPFSPLL
jgi:hypothetical protein